MFLDNHPTLTKREQTMMFDILRRFVHDMEMPLREKIAGQLAKVPNLPRNLAKLLANDAIEIAFPILSQSQALLDADLIEVIQNRSVEHQVAITTRAAISEQVSKVLVETENETVITSLLRNPNAEISSRVIAYLAEESRRVTSYQEPILSRKDLDPKLAERMFTWVSSALRQYILDTYELDPVFVDEVMKEASREGAEEGSVDAAKDLARQLAKEGQATPDLMIKALSEGETTIFISIFRELTGIDESIIMQMISEPAGTGLAVACKAYGFEKSVFSSIYALCQKSSAATEKSSGRDLRRVQQRFDHMSQKAARDVVMRWRRNMNYSAAMNELEVL